jgi:hypothetical protein
MTPHRSSRGRRAVTLAAWITRLDQGLFRSRLARQAQAILVDPALTSRPAASGERGAASAGRPGGEGRRRGVIRNIHATNAPAASGSSRRSSLARVPRQRRRSGEPRILAGDLNMLNPSLPGYENGAPGDHVLSGLPASRLTAAAGAAVQNGVVLSDHRSARRQVTFEARAQFPCSRRSPTSTQARSARSPARRTRRSPKARARLPDGVAGA